jgi:cytochrome c
MPLDSTTEPKFKTLLVLSAILLWTSFFAWAGDRGTADEAKALLAKAIDHYKEVGRKQALEDFMSKKAPWLDRDLYVACLDSNHVLVANGAYPQYVGQNILDMTKAKNGKPLGQALWDAASNGGTETVEWMWFNLVSHKLENKAGLAEKADADVACTVGYYKP